MRKIREVLRLHLGEGLSPRQVAASLSLPRITVRRYLERAHLAGVVWPPPEGMDDEHLERRLFAPPPPPSATRPLPEWPVVHQELRRKDVTLQLLWLEYKEGAPDGYQYSQFCRRYREWQRHLDVVMRQEHRAGEKLFVDWAGRTVPIVNPITGVITPAQLFVSVLGASNYLYAEAFPSQELAHWIAGHVHAFEAFGSLPRIVVCDNLRAGVSKAHRYEPMLNPTYQEMAAWYGVAVIPARAYKPRDKAKIEVGVLIAERWILARLRHRTFFSLAELNAAIRGLVSWLNERPFKKLDGCRRSLFEELERPVMRPLPTQRYEYADWSLAKVNIDYHIEVDRHYYSVPYQLTGQQVEVRLTASVVEVFLRHRRVASHLRSFRRGYHTTDPAHMPASHRRHLEWTPSRIENWAEKTGPSTAELVRGVMESRPHPEQGYRACLGILRLGKRFGDERLEAASRRAVAIRAFSFHSVESILKTGLDRQPLPTSAPSTPARRHQNLRGASYYH
jgi:transposase